MKKLRILSTKKLSPSFRLGLDGSAELFEIDFLRIQQLPLDKLESTILPLLTGKPNLVFTSRHAVLDFNSLISQASALDPSAWQVFCLSGATKTTVRDRLPDAHIAATAENATALAARIAQLELSEVVFFCGNHRRDELPDLLSHKGIRVEEVIVYETELSPVEAPENLDAVLFFSPSAVKSFFILNQLKENVTCFAIGETTAQEIKTQTKNPVVTCNHPGQTNMLDAVNEFAGKMKI